MKISIIASAMMALGGCSPNLSVPPAGETYVVPQSNANGGDPNLFEAHRKALNANGNPVEIRRDILSASTFYLSTASCVDAGINIGYHGPMNTAPAMATAALFTVVPVDDFLSEERHTHIVGLMYDIYAEKSVEMAEWFVESGASDKFGVFFTYKTGQEVHDKFGIPLCEEKIND